MSKVKMVRRKSERGRHRATPYPLPASDTKIMEDTHPRKWQKSSKNKEWQDATCSVCMEYPHNAVLLLCSSYHKNCRPYMCATSYRYSNCLDQYKKAYTRVSSNQAAQTADGSIDDPNLSLPVDGANEKAEISELLCPLCRGQVKGWTVVEPARKYLNSKKRSCMQDNCSYVGTYKQLRKHVRADHPWARPREVDPLLAEKWKKLENDRERSDVMSTISSTMPGSIIMGDYVIERNFRGFSRDYDMDDYFGSLVLRLGSYDGRRNDNHAINDRRHPSLDVVEDDESIGVSRQRIGRIASLRIPRIPSLRHRAGT